MHWSSLELRAFSEVVLPAAMKINRVFVSFISGPDRTVGYVSNLVISLRDCALRRTHPLNVYDALTATVSIYWINLEILIEISSRAAQSANAFHLFARRQRVPPKKNL
jgi:hypothetical protein